MVTPAARRQGVQRLVAANLAVVRRACRLVGLSRSRHRHQRLSLTDTYDDGDSHFFIYQGTF